MTDVLYLAKGMNDDFGNITKESRRRTAKHAKRGVNSLREWEMARKYMRLESDLHRIKTTYDELARALSDPLELLLPSITIGLSKGPSTRGEMIIRTPQFYQPRTQTIFGHPHIARQLERHGLQTARTYYDTVIEELQNTQRLPTQWRGRGEIDCDSRHRIDLSIQSITLDEYKRSRRKNAQ